jgi:serine/threonine protein phosphatase PrpC
VLSAQRGKVVTQLTKDHKPLDPAEYARIQAAGGNVTQLSLGIGNNMKVGPYRVFPGSLTISRALGDLEAKDSRIGGNPDVVLSIPDVSAFPILPEHDFIFLASDGIFDVLTNEEIVNIIWDTAEMNVGFPENVICGTCIDTIIKVSLERNSHDNVSAILIFFDGFREKIASKKHPTLTLNSNVSTNGNEKSQASDQGLLLQDNNLPSSKISLIGKPVVNGLSGPVQPPALLQRPASTAPDFLRKQDE